MHGITWSVYTMNDLQCNFTFMIPNNHLKNHLFYKLVSKVSLFQTQREHSELPLNIDQWCLYNQQMSIFINNRQVFIWCRTTMSQTLLYNCLQNKLLRSEDWMKVVPFFLQWTIQCNKVSAIFCITKQFCL